MVHRWTIAMANMPPNEWHAKKKTCNEYVVHLLQQLPSSVSDVISCGNSRVYRWKIVARAARTPIGLLSYSLSFVTLPFRGGYQWRTSSIRQMLRSQTGQSRLRNWKTNDWIKKKILDKTLFEVDRLIFAANWIFFFNPGQTYYCRSSIH